MVGIHWRWVVMFVVYTRISTSAAKRRTFVHHDKPSEESGSYKYNDPAVM